MQPAPEPGLSFAFPSWCVECNTGRSSAQGESSKSQSQNVAAESRLALPGQWLEELDELSDCEENSSPDLGDAQVRCRQYE